MGTLKCHVCKVDLISGGCKTPNYKVQGFLELRGKNGPRVVAEAVDARRPPRRSDLITKHLSAKFLRISGVRPTTAGLNRITRGFDQLLQGLAGLLRV